MIRTLHPKAEASSVRRRPRGFVAAVALAAAFVAGALAPVAAGAAPATDRLTLLVPDGADLNAWQLKVWIDTAAEEGVALEVISDSALLAMGSGAASRIAGLIVPDSGHMKASDALVAAVKQYAYLGGRLMLVYDAGVLTEGGAYPLTGNSRFADLVGVQYALWNNGAGASTMVGFGPVVGTGSRLDALSFPPGKYLPYTPLATASTTSLASTAAYVPTTSSDPSGQQAMRGVIAETRTGGFVEGSRSVREARRAAGTSLSSVLGLSTQYLPSLRYGSRNASATPALTQHVGDRIVPRADRVAAKLTSTTNLLGTLVNRTLSAVELAPTTAAAAPSTSLQQISGYGYGSLGYYSYVTTGTFPGTVWLSSPDHGLVAGLRTWGSGQVLFVNLPLGYFKAIGTDGAPLHGFLSQFAREQVGVATMSVQPRARGGLVYNWHIDDGDDLRDDTKYLLDATRVFRRGPFSLHLTAGPDVITFGDGKGQNLPNDTQSRTQLKRLASIGVPFWDVLPAHAIGSHGGWIHDYWGANASEANVPDLTSLLQKNFDAIEAVTGRRIREYSSPQGNTPSWAVRWLEQRGVVATYLVADVGAGVVRSWRDGKRLSPSIWTFPVTPFGTWATFEEFEENGVTDTASGQWLLDLQSFAVNHRTTRMFYNHPPGARGHLNPVNALLDRADQLASNGSFAWYTMTQMADFSQRRVATAWSRTVSGTTATWTASNAASLTDQAWLLPKLSYASPAIVSGSASITQDTVNWIVTANGGTSLKFKATLR